MSTPRWLLLTHQLPNEPSNLRVKVWRKLQALGAVPIKNSIYVLPNKRSTREDFEWLRDEILQSGGAATVFAGDSIAEKDDKEIVRDFHEARAKDYGTLAESVEAFCDKLKSALSGGHIKHEAQQKLERQWPVFRAEWDRIAKIDFFGTPSKKSASAALSRAQALLGRAKSVSVERAPAPPVPMSAKDLKGAVWVTRTSPHIDRLASAWLVRRFVDPKSRFKFVTPPYGRHEGELRFDMPEGEFTHFGDWCTFETIIHRLGLKDAALGPLAEIIHDIDLKDAKFGRPESSGVALSVYGLCRRRRDDFKRLEAGFVYFDDLFEALKPKESGR